jgi:hypothetical protein
MGSCYATSVMLEYASRMTYRLSGCTESTHVAGESVLLLTADTSLEATKVAIGNFWAPYATGI